MHAYVMKKTMHKVLMMHKIIAQIDMYEKLRIGLGMIRASNTQ